MSAADAMQLISIVIAINAMITGLFLWGLNKDKKDIKKNMKNIELHAQYLDLLSQQLVEWMLSKETFEKAERGMLYNILKKNNENKTGLDKFGGITLSKRIECKRNLQHLMLFSKDEIRLDSAHKQLINAFGNADSIKILEKLEALNDSNGLHKAAATQLNKRINSHIKAGYKKANKH